MHDAIYRRLFALRPILCVIGLLALAGCQDDPITHSIVPRASEPEKTHLLGVIYPRGDQTWFFKLTGPESAVNEVTESFNGFMNSVRFTDKADAPVTWTAPEGWKEEKGPAPRYATFHLGPKEKPIELSVTMLGKEAAGILPNVNRWRGQLGLAPVDEAGLAELTKDIKVNDGSAVLVSMTGSTAKGAAPNPMAMAPPMGVKRSFNYQKPGGWQEEPHPERGAMPREALFAVADGGEKAEVSVTVLGNGGGGLMANVARWAGQAGAPEVTAEQMDKFPKITVAGHESPLIDLTGKKGRTIGAIITAGAKTWFFKMTGPSEVVEKHKAEFEAFLKSVKFAGGPGGEQ
jgi:hypothetical protein